MGKTSEDIILINVELAENVLSSKLKLGIYLIVYTFLIRLHFYSDDTHPVPSEHPYFKPLRSIIEERCV